MYKSIFYLEPSTIAPPPGFGPQKPRESHTTPSTSNNIYSLWGNSGSVQGLFQQTDGQYLLHFSMIIMNTYFSDVWLCMYILYMYIITVNNKLVHYS